MGGLALDCCSNVDAHHMPEFDFLQQHAEDGMPDIQCQLPNSLAHHAGFCMPSSTLLDKSEDYDLTTNDGVGVT